MELDPQKVFERHQRKLEKLGSITEESAILERIPEAAFCALVGSKFAVVIASLQNAEWLIQHCRALADAHRELSDSQRGAILCALTACTAAAQRRNGLLHAILAQGDVGTSAEAADRLALAPNSG